MEIKITLFITLVLYAAVISQSFFYMLGMAGATRGMQINSYIEARQLLDKYLSHSLPFIYYGTLVASIALTAFCVTNPSGLLFISAVIALVALLIDMIVTIKGNVPLNREIRNWTNANYPANWNDFRSRWLSIYQLRQVANLTGFIALVAGIIFGI